MPVNRPELLSPALLITESMSSFNRAHQELTAEFPPRGAIDKNLIFDLAHLRFEIERCRRVVAACTNVNFCEALANILTGVVRAADEWPFEAEEDAEAIAARWFTDDTTKRQISTLLRKLSLDESAIEAEAMRRAAPQIDFLERLIASLDRDGIGRCVPSANIVRNRSAD